MIKTIIFNEIKAVRNNFFNTFYLLRKFTLHFSSATLLHSYKKVLDCFLHLFYFYLCGLIYFITFVLRFNHVLWSILWFLHVKNAIEIHFFCFFFTSCSICVFTRIFFSGISSYLMVYSSVPSSVIRSSLLGMVMLCATDFLPLWKNVSGVQILLAIKLLRRSTAMGPLNFNLSSFQLCLKKTSIVYSYRTGDDTRVKNI